MNFDFNSVLLLLTRGDSSYQQIALLLIIPFIGKMFESLLQTARSLYEEYRRETWVHIDFEGSPGTFGQKYSKSPAEFSLAFRAISHYISENYECTSLKEARPSDEAPVADSSFTKFVVSQCINLDLKNGMFIDSRVETPLRRDGSASREEQTIQLRLRSKTRTIVELKEFVAECVRVYNNYSAKMNKDKLYHFIYKGKTGSESLRFSSAVISDLASDTNRSFETFDHVFNEHKSSLVDDMDLLADTEYYRANGLKRKKGYLFYGDPGCGKTYSVMAMANHGKRHIIEVPMARVKTNEELEDIINSTTINGISFEKSQVIILFDEIDCGTNSLKKRDGVGEVTKEPVEDPTKGSEETALGALEKILSSRGSEEKDKLSLGTVLSRLDGIGSYNGILFIATTNCINSLDPALYRHGRLDPYYFTFSRREDIKGMIEWAFKVELTEKQIAVLPDRESKVSPSTVKKYIHDHRKNLGGLLEKLGELRQ